MIIHEFSLPDKSGSHVLRMFYEKNIFFDSLLAVIRAAVASGGSNRNGGSDGTGSGNIALCSR